LFQGAPLHPARTATAADTTRRDRDGIGKYYQSRDVAKREFWL
jgi:hypothetical protein